MKVCLIRRVDLPELPQPVQKDLLAQGWTLTPASMDQLAEFLRVDVNFSLGR
jgi:hypothetical protein